MESAYTYRMLVSLCFYEFYVDVTQYCELEGGGMVSSHTFSWEPATILLQYSEAETRVWLSRIIRT